MNKIYPLVQLVKASRRSVFFIIFLLTNVLGLCIRMGNRSTKAEFIKNVEFCTSARLTETLVVRRALYWIFNFVKEK